MKVGNIKNDNYELIIKHSETDDFSQLLIINGLYPRNGGTPIQYVLDKIIPGIREKLVKKYKTIKPADIKNKLKVFLNIRFFQGLEFTSQEKIEISNDKNSIDKVLGNIDWDKVVRQLLKDEDLMLAITEYFSLKEKAKENAELKKLSKTTKKIKSDKYYPAIKEERYLTICEGTSARSGLMNILGRDKFSYYELKGVPLNAWELPLSKVTSNKEMSELYKILVNKIEEKELQDGEWFEIEIDNKTYIVNENDEIKIDGKWIEVKDLL